MNRIKNVSQRGLERLALHEGVVPGIYDCPAKHATFGIGTLVHTGRSEILRVIGAEKPEYKSAAPLKRHLKAYKPSAKSAGVPYLDAAIGQDAAYPAFVKEMLAGNASKARLIEAEHALLEAGWSDYMKKFRTRLDKFEKAVRQVFSSVALTQDQFDGLLSITYNIGEKGLQQSGGLIAAMTLFVKASADPKATQAQRDKVASVLLEAILRARPTARAAVEVSIDGNSFGMMEPGVFNSGLFNRRVAEASLIIGRKYSTKEAEITIAKRTIKAERDHQTTQKARSEARAVVDMLNKISFVNRGFH